MPSWSAIVLAGGRGARLDGADKAAVRLGGRTLLAWVLDAVGDADEVVVVGDAVPTERVVRFTRESPRYGGPAAGLLSGLDALEDPPTWVAVVAVDMPRLSRATMQRLMDATVEHDGAVLVGPDGRRQLALVVASARLQEVRPDRAHQRDLALWRLLAPLDLVEVAAVGDEHRDVDTWTDLDQLS